MQRPQKPYPDFPLTVHPNGQWCKVVKTKVYYFGSWRADPRGETALKEWLTRKDGIYAGLDHLAQLDATAAGMSVGELFRKYLMRRSRDVEGGRLSPETFRDYTYNLNDFYRFIGPDAKAAGLKPQHFSAYRASLEDRKLGPHATKRVLASVKAAFNYAMKEEWITPIRFGVGFDAPNTDSEAVALYHMRAGKQSRTERLLTRKEACRLLRATKDKPQWRAILLMMLNTAVGPSELARLKWGEINFKSGRLRRRRWKTGILQEAYLWKITRKTLEALPRSHAEWIFVCPSGKQLMKTEPIKGQTSFGEEAIVRVRRSNRVNPLFHDLMESLGLGEVTPYSLRRTARTLAAHSTDDNAAKRMMGQRLAGRDQTYIKGKFPLSRLRRLSLCIYRQLFGRRQPPPQAPDPDANKLPPDNTAPGL